MLGMLLTGFACFLNPLSKSPSCFRFSLIVMFAKVCDVLLLYRLPSDVSPLTVFETSNTFPPLDLSLTISKVLSFFLLLSGFVCFANW